MKIRVNLSGPLAESFAGYDSRTGLIVDVPENARVSDVLNLLGIEGKKYLVIADHKIVRLESPLDLCRKIHVFQALAGG